MSWAAAEFDTIALGDKRLDKRAVLLAEQLAAKPGSSIPQACGGWAETQAAYRFFDNDEVAWGDIMAAHWRASIERMRAHPVVLCLQDTTELNFNGQRSAGLGPLSYETQRGMYVHPTYAITPAREPLGVLDAWMWARQFKDEKGVRGADVCESTRWLEGYARLAELARELPDTRLVYVADREADIAAFMAQAKALGHRLDWLIRSSHNRVLPAGDKLWAKTCEGKPLGAMQFVMASRKGHKARPVRQHVWASRQRISDGAGGTIDITCVVAREVDAPKGVKPIEWRLVSNRAAGNLQEAVQLIDWYRARWEIEMFFHVLKNGCRIEQLQLASMDKLQRALALLMVVAWRIGRLMRLGRACPELDAALMFEPEEWQAAYILNGKEPPGKSPRLNEVVRLVAMLGGFLARKHDAEPGVKTIWLGLQRVVDFAAGIKFQRQIGGLRKSCV